MELIDLLRIVRRWLWLIVAIVVVTELALWLGTQTAKPVYSATVSLQVTVPQSESVQAYDVYRSISLRDEIVTAINNFVELLQSDEVRQRVISQLGLEGDDALYSLTAEHMTDADFVDVSVETRTPSMAAEIANTHVSVAIAYYGELRAKITNADKDLFAEQLQVAEQEYQAAENALADFRTQNGIFSLESQMQTQQDLLAQLQLERDQRLLDQAAASAIPADGSVPVAATPAVDLVAEVDKLIAQRQKELDQFTALAPQYNILTQNVEQARAAYEHLLEKNSEAQLKATAVKAANFIQVIKPAYTPAESESSWPKLAVLAFAGSLGLGVMLTLLLQYIYGSKTMDTTVVPESDQETLSRRRKGRKAVAQSQEPKNSESDHETLAYGDMDRGLWKRLRNIFRRNNSSYERESRVSSKDLDAEQESIVVPPHDSTETEAA